MSRHVASSVDPETYFEKMSDTVAGLVSAERAGFWQLTGTELIPLHEQVAAVTGDSLNGPHAVVLDVENDQDLARLLVSGEAVRLNSR